MKHYEIVFVVHPDQSGQVSSLIEKYRGFIESEKGTVHRLEDWGRRQLAYPIDKLLKAHYVLLNVECTISALENIQENFRYNDAVIRNMVIVRNEAVTGKSQLMDPPRDYKAKKSFDDNGNGYGNKSGYHKKNDKPEASAENNTESNTKSE
jgi:small subunit ribosomal protein S6